MENTLGSLTRFGGGWWRVRRRQCARLLGGGLALPCRGTDRPVHQAHQGIRHGGWTGQEVLQPRPRPGWRERDRLQVQLFFLLHTVTLELWGLLPSSEARSSLLLFKTGLDLVLVQLSS